IWIASEGVNSVVQSSVFDGKHWTTPVCVSLPCEDVQSPQLAVDQKGNVAVIWEKLTEMNRIVQAALCPAHGKWLLPVDLSDSFFDASEPQIKIDQEGRITALWTQS